jgi:hypothetical protein
MKKVMHRSISGPLAQELKDDAVASLPKFNLFDELTRILELSDDRNSLGVN